MILLQPCFAMAESLNMGVTVLPRKTSDTINDFNLNSGVYQVSYQHPVATEVADKVIVSAVKETKPNWFVRIYNSIANFLKR